MYVEAVPMDAEATFMDDSTVLSDSAPFVQGIASFSNLHINKPGRYKLRFWCPKIAGRPGSVAIVSALSPLLTIDIGPPAQLILLREPSGGTGGLPFLVQPRTSVADIAGNIIPEVSEVSIGVSVLSNPSQSLDCHDTGLVSLTLSFQGSDAVEFSGLCILKATSSEQLIFTVTSSSLPSLPVGTNVLSKAFPINVGPTARMVIIQYPSGGTVGVPFENQPILELQDAGGNRNIHDSYSSVSVGVFTDPTATYAVDTILKRRRALITGGTLQQSSHEKAHNPSMHGQAPTKPSLLTTLNPLYLRRPYPLHVITASVVRGSRYIYLNRDPNAFSPASLNSAANITPEATGLPPLRAGMHIALGYPSTDAISQLNLPLGAPFPTHHSSLPSMYPPEHTTGVRIKFIPAGGLGWVDVAEAGAGFLQVPGERSSRMWSPAERQFRIELEHPWPGPTMVDAPLHVVESALTRPVIKGRAEFKGLRVDSMGKDMQLIFVSSLMNRTHVDAFMAHTHSPLEVSRQNALHLMREKLMGSSHLMIPQAKDLFPPLAPSLFVPNSVIAPHPNMAANPNQIPHPGLPGHPSKDVPGTTFAGHGRGFGVELPSVADPLLFHSTPGKKQRKLQGLRITPPSSGDGLAAARSEASRVFRRPDVHATPSVQSYDPEAPHTPVKHDDVPLLVPLATSPIPGRLATLTPPMTIEPGPPTHLVVLSCDMVAVADGEFLVNPPVVAVTDSLGNILHTLHDIPVTVSLVGQTTSPNKKSAFHTGTYRSSTYFPSYANPLDAKVIGGTTVLLEAGVAQFESLGFTKPSFPRDLLLAATGRSVDNTSSLPLPQTHLYLENSPWEFNRTTVNTWDAGRTGAYLLQFEAFLPSDGKSPLRRVHAYWPIQVAPSNSYQTTPSTTHPLPAPLAPSGRIAGESTTLPLWAISHLHSSFASEAPRPLEAILASEHSAGSPTTPESPASNRFGHASAMTEDLLAVSAPLESVRVPHTHVLRLISTPPDNANSVHTPLGPVVPEIQELHIGGSWQPQIVRLHFPLPSPPPPLAPGATQQHGLLQGSLELFFPSLPWNEFEDLAPGETFTFSLPMHPSYLEQALQEYVNRVAPNHYPIPPRISVVRALPTDPLPVYDKNTGRYRAVGSYGIPDSSYALDEAADALMEEFWRKYSDAFVYDIVFDNCPAPLPMLTLSAHAVTYIPPHEVADPDEPPLPIPPPVPVIPYLQLLQQATELGGHFTLSIPALNTPLARMPSVIARAEASAGIEILGSRSSLSIDESKDPEFPFSSLHSTPRVLYTTRPIPIDVTPEALQQILIDDLHLGSAEVTELILLDPAINQPLDDPSSYPGSSPSDAQNPDTLSEFRPPYGTLALVPGRTLRVRFAADPMRPDVPTLVPDASTLTGPSPYVHVRVLRNGHGLPHGSFVLAHAGATTPPIRVTASAQDIKDALLTLPSVLAAEVDVLGLPSSTAPGAEPYSTQGTAALPVPLGGQVLRHWLISAILNDASESSAKAFEVFGEVPMDKEGETEDEEVYSQAFRPIEVLTESPGNVFSTHWWTPVEDVQSWKKGLVGSVTTRVEILSAGAPTSGSDTSYIATQGGRLTSAVLYPQALHTHIAFLLSLFQAPVPLSCVPPSRFSFFASHASDTPAGIEWLVCDATPTEAPHYPIIPLEHPPWEYPYLRAGESGTGRSRGAVYLYQREGRDWQLSTKLVPQAPFPLVSKDEQLGANVAIDQSPTGQKAVLVATAPGSRSYQPLPTLDVTCRATSGSFLIQYTPPATPDTSEPPTWEPEFPDNTPPPYPRHDTSMLTRPIHVSATVETVVQVLQSLPGVWKVHAAPLTGNNDPPYHPYDEVIYETLNPPPPPPPFSETPVGYRSRNLHTSLCGSKLSGRGYRFTLLAPSGGAWDTLTWTPEGDFALDPSVCDPNPALDPCVALLEPEIPEALPPVPDAALGEVTGAVYVWETGYDAIPSGVSGTPPATGIPPTPGVSQPGLFDSTARPSVSFGGDQNWIQSARIAPTTLLPADLFAAAVAVSVATGLVDSSAPHLSEAPFPPTIAIGAPGTKVQNIASGVVYIYQKRVETGLSFYRMPRIDSGNWYLHQTLTSETDHHGPGEDFYFGTSVAFAGPNTLYVGAPGANDGQGLVYVYKRQNVEGALFFRDQVIKPIIPTATDPHLFTHKSMNPFLPPAAPVSAAQTSFTQPPHTLPSRPLLFGHSIAASPHTLAVGAPGALAYAEGAKGLDTGCVYLYDRLGWNTPPRGGPLVQRHVACPDEGVPGQGFGSSVSISNTVLLVGSRPLDLSDSTTYGQGDVHDIDTHLHTLFPLLKPRILPKPVDPYATFVLTMNIPATETPHPHKDRFWVQGGFFLTRTVSDDEQNYGGSNGQKPEDPFDSSEYGDTANSSKTVGKTVLRSRYLPYSASPLQLRAALEIDLQLGPVSVRRSGIGRSGTYEWTVRFLTPRYTESGVLLPQPVVSVETHLCTLVLGANGKDAQGNQIAREVPLFRTPEGTENSPRVFPFHVPTYRVPHSIEESADDAATLGGIFASSTPSSLSSEALHRAFKQHSPPRGLQCDAAIFPQAFDPTHPAAPAPTLVWRETAAPAATLPRPQPVHLYVRNIRTIRSDRLQERYMDPTFAAYHGTPVTPVPTYFGGKWTLHSLLTPTRTQAYDSFGYSLALSPSGAHAMVSAPTRHVATPFLRYALRPSFFGSSIKASSLVPRPVLSALGYISVGSGSFFSYHLDWLNFRWNIPPLSTKVTAPAIPGYDDVVKELLLHNTPGYNPMIPFAVPSVPEHAFDSTLLEAEIPDMVLDLISTLPAQYHTAEYRSSLEKLALLNLFGLAKEIDGGIGDTRVTRLKHRGLGQIHLKLFEVAYCSPFCVIDPKYLVGWTPLYSPFAPRSRHPSPHTVSESLHPITPSGLSFPTVVFASAAPADVWPGRKTIPDHPVAALMHQSPATTHCDAGVGFTKSTHEVYQGFTPSLNPPTFTPPQWTVDPLRRYINPLTGPPYAFPSESLFACRQAVSTNVECLFSEALHVLESEGSYHIPTDTSSNPSRARNVDYLATTLPLIVRVPNDAVATPALPAGVSYFDEIFPLSYSTAPATTHYPLLILDDAVAESTEYLHLHLSLPGVIPAFAGPSWASLALEDDQDGIIGTKIYTQSHQLQASALADPNDALNPPDSASIPSVFTGPEPDQDSNDFSSDEAGTAAEFTYAQGAASARTAAVPHTFSEDLDPLDLSAEDTSHADAKKRLEHALYRDGLPSGFGADLDLSSDGLFAVVSAPATPGIVPLSLHCILAKVLDRWPLTDTCASTNAETLLYEFSNVIPQVGQVFVYESIMGDWKKIATLQNPLFVALITQLRILHHLDINGQSFHPTDASERVIEYFSFLQGSRFGSDVDIASIHPGAAATSHYWIAATVPGTASVATYVWSPNAAVAPSTAEEETGLPVLVEHAFTHPVSLPGRTDGMEATTPIGTGSWWFSAELLAWHSLGVQAGTATGGTEYYRQTESSDGCGEYGTLAMDFTDGELAPYVALGCPGLEAVFVYQLLESTEVASYTYTYPAYETTEKGLHKHPSTPTFPLIASTRVWAQCDPGYVTTYPSLVPRSEREDTGLSTSTLPPADSPQVYFTCSPIHATPQWLQSAAYALHPPTPHIPDSHWYLSRIIRHAHFHLFQTLDGHSNIPAIFPYPYRFGSTLTASASSLAVSVPFAAAETIQQLSSSGTPAAFTNPTSSTVLDHALNHGVGMVAVYVLVTGADIQRIHIDPHDPTLAHEVDGVYTRGARWSEEFGWTAAEARYRDGLSIPAYVEAKRRVTWMHHVTIVPPPMFAVPGTGFGRTLAMDKGTLVVGAPLASDTGTERGASASGSSSLEADASDAGVSVTWDFETGDLRGWASTGTAFARQPTRFQGAYSRPGIPSHLSLASGLSSHSGNGKQSNIGRFYVNTYEANAAPRRPTTFSEPDAPAPALVHPHLSGYGQIGVGWTDGRPVAEYSDPETWDTMNAPTPGKLDTKGQIQGCGPQGTLTSSPFLIAGPEISFLVGGGCDIRVLYVELLVDGVPDPRYKVTGACDQEMRRIHWDVSTLMGKTGLLRVVDASSTNPWGYISVDSFEFQWTHKTRSLDMLQAGAVFVYRRYLRLPSAPITFDHPNAYYPPNSFKESAGTIPNSVLAHKLNQVNDGLGIVGADVPTSSILDKVNHLLHTDERNAFSPSDTTIPEDYMAAPYNEYLRMHPAYASLSTLPHLPAPVHGSLFLPTCPGAFGPGAPASPSFHQDNLNSEFGDTNFGKGPLRSPLACVWLLETRILPSDRRPYLQFGSALAVDEEAGILLVGSSTHLFSDLPLSPNSGDVSSPHPGSASSSSPLRTHGSKLRSGSNASSMNAWEASVASLSTHWPLDSTTPESLYDTVGHLPAELISAYANPTAALLYALSRSSNAASQTSSGIPPSLALKDSWAQIASLRALRLYTHSASTNNANPTYNLPENVAPPRGTVYVYRPLPELRSAQQTIVRPRTWDGVEHSVLRDNLGTTYSPKNAPSLALHQFLALTSEPGKASITFTNLDYTYLNFDRTDFTSPRTSNIYSPHNSYSQSHTPFVYRVREGDLRYPNQRRLREVEILVYRHGVVHAKPGTPAALLQSETLHVHFSTRSITAVGVSDAMGTVCASIPPVERDLLSCGDYVTTSGELIFPPGVSLQKILIPLIDDGCYKGERSFAVDLSIPGTGRIRGAGYSALVVIEDDDGTYNPYNSPFEFQPYTSPEYPKANPAHPLPHRRDNEPMADPFWNEDVFDSGTGGDSQDGDYFDFGVGFDGASRTWTLPVDSTKKGSKSRSKNNNGYEKIPGLTRNYGVCKDPSKTWYQSNRYYNAKYDAAVNQQSSNSLQTMVIS